MALSELGFERPTYDEILEKQESRAKELFGENIDTSEITALGKLIRINVLDIDTLYQTLEGVYYARFPNTATGVSLDRLCPFAGITRNSATYARHEVFLTGAANETIEAGFEVSNETQSVIFHLTEDCTLGDEGTATAYVDCNIAGISGNIVSSTINTIVNPSAVVDSVKGVQLVTVARDKESDKDLRERFTLAIAGTGSNSAEAIKGAILRVNGVYGCVVVENATSETVDEIPPYSFVCFVHYDNTPATEQLIAEAIFSKKPLGIKTYGGVTKTVDDESGISHTIRFEKTTEKNVWIKVALKRNKYFPVDGEEQIKKNIINYIETLTNGETLYMSKLMTCIHIEGVEFIASVQFSLSNTSSFDRQAVSCSYNEIVRTANEKILVEYIQE